MARSHQTLSDLMMATRIEMDPDEVTDIMSRVDVTLRRHFEIEDEHLYPALLAVVDDWEDRGVVLGAHEDHRVIMRLLEDLESVLPSEERFRGMVHTLDRMWQHHIEEEEGALCDLAQRYLDTDGFRDLRSKIRDAEKAQRKEVREIERKQEAAGEMTRVERRVSRQHRK